MRSSVSRASALPSTRWTASRPISRCLPARRRQRAGRHRDIGLDAVQRVDGNALALAQAMNQLAVVDHPAAERRFRHVGLTAELGDLAENLVVLHRAGFGKYRWAGRDDLPV